MPGLPIIFKLNVGYPGLQDEREIVRRRSGQFEINKVLTKEDIFTARQLVDQVYVDEKVTDYILRIVFATRHPKEYGVNAENLIMYGASPRASIGLTIAAKAHAFLHGRAFVTPHDIKQLAHDVLRHRIRRTYEAEAEEVSPDIIIDRILETIPVP